MKQYKSAKTLNNAIEKWLYDEILIKHFKFKGDVENKEEIRKFYGSKQIHTISDTNDIKKIITFFVYHKNKLRFSATADYNKLTWEVHDLNARK